MILRLLSYIGMLTSFILLTLAIASGLYYLSELVEEYTVVTKRVLVRIIYAVITILVLLWMMDSFPFWLTTFAIISHIVYLQNLRRFPFISLSSITFIASCILVVLNHILWFRYFSDPSLPPASIYLTRPDYSGPTHPPFSQVASFMGFCVWLTPFALFISLSASENVLPTSTETSDDPSIKAKQQGHGSGLAKVIIEYAWTVVAKVGSQLGYDLDWNSSSRSGLLA